MPVQIDQVDTPSAPEPLLRELADYYVVIEEDDMPGDPAMPMAQRIADWRNIPVSHPAHRWIVRDGGEIVAAGVVAYDLEQNVENGFGRIHVHPDHRGRGHARALAGPMLEHLADRGCLRFDTWIKQGHPAESLAGRLGLRRVITEKRSRLAIEALDHDLMAGWIAGAADRAADYELLYLTLPLPEEFVERFCDLTYVMNTAPRDDYQEDDEVLTPETWRDMEQSILKAQCQLHTLIAVHGPTGEFAGYTQIRTQALQPDLAWQWDTGVHTDHRNRGLGRWLKAEMIERIVRDYPDVERVDTFNAGSNKPMLAINIAMGFRPIHVSSAWQGPLATVRERLGV